MQHFRSQLTRLKSLIGEKLPDGEDIFGFSGVSKALLVSAVDTAYTLSRDIEEKDDDTHFEVIALKRAGSKVHQEFKDFLESLRPDKPDTKVFDRFLTDLSELVEKTKLVYLVVNKDGIRDDLELQAIRSKISGLTAGLDKLAALQVTYGQNAEKIKTSLSVVESSHKKADELTDDIQEWYEAAGSQSEEIEQLHEKVTGWEAEFAKRSAEIRVINEQVAALQKTAQQLKQDFEASVKAGNESAEMLKRLTASNQTLQEEIRKTLGDANRVGMAGSFKERKADVDKGLFWWRVAFIVTLPAIAGLAWVLLEQSTQQSVDWGGLVVRIGVLSPLVWLGWFSARQFSYLSRISEDYAFKYAASMAYEGFKKATRETDEELERVLLEFSLFNMAQNPIRLYDGKADHASPAHEMLDTVLSSLRHMKKVTLQLPKIGKVVVESRDKSRSSNQNEDDV